MKIANPIRNEVGTLQILNLSQLLKKSEGRGPFLMIQDGCDPGDPRMRACSFVLTRRGTWLHFYLYLALSEVARARCAQFETVAEALAAAGSLGPEVRVESAESLQAFLREEGFEPGIGDFSGQALLEEIRRRHGGSGGETTG